MDIPVLKKYFHKYARLVVSNVVPISGSLQYAKPSPDYKIAFSPKDSGSPDRIDILVSFDRLSVLADEENLHFLSVRFLLMRFPRVDPSEDIVLS